ncbi:MAG: hypothetical protein ACLT1K_03410 [[Clostridium] leptum]
MIRPRLRKWESPAAVTKAISIAPVPRNCAGATAKDVNVPVSCGGAVVNPGDYLFGDIGRRCG